MTASQSATANFADRLPDPPLPELPEGYEYGHRIGGWGPYSVRRIKSDARGPLHDVSTATKGDRSC